MKRYDQVIPLRSSFLSAKPILKETNLKLIRLITFFIILLNISHLIAKPSRHLEKVESLKEDLQLHFEKYFIEFENSKNFLENGVLRNLDSNLSHFEKINLMLGCLKHKKEIHDYDNPLAWHQFDYLDNLPKKDMPLLSSFCTDLESNQYYNKLFKQITAVAHSPTNGSLYNVNFEINSKLLNGRISENFFMNSDESNKQSDINTTAYAASHGFIAVPNGTTLTSFFDLTNQVSKSFTPEILNTVMESPIIKGRSFLNLNPAIYGSTTDVEVAFKALLNEVAEYENLLDDTVYISEQFEIFVNKLKDAISHDNLANYLPEKYRYSNLKFYLDHITPQLLKCS